jgi:CBS domain-containing protein
MLACVIADMIAIRYLPSSIMTEKLARRGLSVPEEYDAGIMKIVRVGEVMRKDVAPIPPEMTVAELSDRMGRGEPAFNVTQGLPIVDKDARLVGIVTQGDLLRALETDSRGEITVLDAGSNAPIVAYQDEIVFDAMFRMLQNNIGRLPVVSRDDPQRLIGFFTRSSVLGAWSRHAEEEGVREHGWLTQLLRNGN